LRGDLRRHGKKKQGQLAHAITSGKMARGTCNRGNLLRKSEKVRQAEENRKPGKNRRASRLQVLLGKKKGGKCRGHKRRSKNERGGGGKPIPVSGLEKRRRPEKILRKS